MTQSFSCNYYMVVFSLHLVLD